MSLVHIRFPLAAVLCLTVFLAATSRADAGVLVAGAENCDQPPLEQPFLRWADPMQYFLAPDGSFAKRADGWSTTLAKVTPENQPYSAHADEGLASLRLRDGGSATTPVVCVGVEHPTLRFFARNDGSLLGTLRVDVMFEDATGDVNTLPIGLVSGGDEWSPTLPMPILANLLALLPGERTPVAFRFTAEDSAWLIDDVYVDPYSKG